MEVEKKNLLNPEVPLNEAEAQKSYGAAPEYQSTQPTIVYAPAPQQAVRCLEIRMLGKSVSW